MIVLQNAVQIPKKGTARCFFCKFRLTLSGGFDIMGLTDYFLFAKENF